VCAEVLAESPKGFFCPDHMDWIHAAHLMDFFVITSSWLIDVVFKDMIHGSANASSILVILRLWRVIRVLSGMGTFIAKQKKMEFQILRIKRKLQHAYVFLEEHGQLEDYFASDGIIDQDEIRIMREIRAENSSLMEDIKKEKNDLKIFGKMQRNLKKSGSSVADAAKAAADGAAAARVVPITVDGEQSNNETGRPRLRWPLRRWT